MGNDTHVIFGNESLSNPESLGITFILQILQEVVYHLSGKAKSMGAEDGNVQHLSLMLSSSPPQTKTQLYLSTWSQIFTLVCNT